jgi:hypothetical protein
MLRSWILRRTSAAEISRGASFYVAEHLEELVDGAGGKVADLAQLVIQHLAHFLPSDVVPPRKTMSITAISYLYTALGFTDKPSPLT